MLNSPYFEDNNTKNPPSNNHNSNVKKDDLQFMITFSSEVMRRHNIEVGRVELDETRESQRQM
jgi:hypothetical protein